MAIAYPRAVVDTSAFDANNVTVKAGDIVFVERVNPTKRRSDAERDVTIRIYTMDQVNAKFADAHLPGPTPLVGLRANAAKKVFDAFSLDGIVHAVETQEGERAIAQTIVFGPCRLAITAEELDCVAVGEALNVALHVIEGDPPPGEEMRWELRLSRFFGLRVQKAPKDGLAAVRRVGRVTEKHEDPPAVTVEVDIDPLADLTADLGGLSVAS